MARYASFASQCARLRGNCPFLPDYLVSSRIWTDQVTWDPLLRPEVSFIVFGRFGPSPVCVRACVRACVYTHCSPCLVGSCSLCSMFSSSFSSSSTSSSTPRTTTTWFHSQELPSISFSRTSFPPLQTKQVQSSILIMVVKIFFVSFSIKMFFLFWMFLWMDKNLLWIQGARAMHPPPLRLWLVDAT